MCEVFMRVLSLCIDIEGCINRKYYFCTIYFYRKYLQKVEEKKKKRGEGGRRRILIKWDQKR